MNVLLVCPKPELSTRSVFVPLGILSIATHLIEKGHTVKFIDRSICKYDVEQVIKDFQPDIVGISLMSTKSVPDALSISKTAKELGIPVVWGGTLIFSIPGLVLKSGFVDYVVIGEGEITMLALINALIEKTPVRFVNGLAFIENGEVVINEHREFADLAELPVIDWSLADPSKYFRSFFACEKMLYLYGSKGCPCQCTFCTNKEYNRSVCRKRPIEYLLKEIEYLVNNCGMDGIYFTDEYCCKTTSEMHEFCDHLKSTGLNFVWGATTKISDFSEEDFKYMYDAGCRWLFFGIESGSKERLVKIKKGIDYDKIVDTVTNCYNAGIVPITGFIIGFPDESEDELRQTIMLAQKMPFVMHVINIFISLPGSEIHNKLKAERRLGLKMELKDLAKFSPFEEVVQNFSNIPTRELEVIRAFFEMSVFTRRKPSNETKSFVLASKVIKEHFRDMTRDGIMIFFKNFYSSVKIFFTLIFYSVFFPKIRKKYGLYSKVTKKVVSKF
ncbi:MAG: radical SAM protein [Eubacteriales bacterium]